MWLPEEITKCVAFVEVKNDNDEFIPKGTGFLVSMPSEKNPTEFYLYLVTAKHVSTRLTGKDFWVSINDVSGVTKRIAGIKDAMWHHHPNHENDPADVAVIPFPPHETFDIKTVPVSMFLDPELLKNGTIGLGNEVFVTGLFRHFYGKKKNSPVIRMGNIAMLPQEKVPTNDFGDIDAYLIEARSIGGVSGSPVFFCEEQMKGGSLSLGGPKFYLGGVMHGHWDTKGKVDSVPLTSHDERLNVGIAIVTPAFKVLEILNSPTLKKFRDDNDKNLPSA